MLLAAAYGDNILYVRIYDGERYVFPLPFMLTDDCDMHRACLLLSKYAIREMIPLIITDVPREDLDFVADIFPHIDAWCYAEDDDSFAVKINSECDMLEDVPTLEFDGIRLDEILDSDKELYAELCRDRELNKYWGYDADVDNPDGVSDYYIDVVRREFNDGVAVTFAARDGGVFIGEGVIYDFDYLGGASVALRILPRYHGFGYGTRVLRALVKLAARIGLARIKTEILNDNAASIAMTAKVMDKVSSDEEKTYFELVL